eukprot:TRINITY_DN11208_c0_g1_i1.p1 TRINITY_DN11208_c0_g1~~TRINITY_DN11208_c0_g1_i1.p1  ORF type:complete len:129 (-),score=5.12 TRINITY_DN11208_c0_g1_i1:238-624(-)
MYNIAHATSTLEVPVRAADLRQHAIHVPENACNRPAAAMAFEQDQQVHKVTRKCAKWNARQREQARPESGRAHMVGDQLVIDDMQHMPICDSGGGRGSAHSLMLGLICCAVSAACERYVIERCSYTYT